MPGRRDFAGGLTAETERLKRGGDAAGLRRPGGIPAASRKERK